jgi:hypothetical protein
VISPYELELKLSREPGKSVRPAEVLTHVFGLGGEAAASARIIKLKGR